MTFHKSLAAALVLGLATPAAALDLTQMSDAERTMFRAEVRAYLLENPEVIFEAVEVMKQREAEAQVNNDGLLVQTNAEDLFNDPNSWVGGNPDGDITLVEFIDYRCGYCRKAHDEVSELVTSDGEIRFIVKEFPILGEGSILSSRFAIATRLEAGDDAYKAVHDALITLTTDATDIALTRIAEGLGLDASAIMARMNSDEVSQIIEANHALAGRMQITGTPTFVMQDQMLRGYVPLDAMRQILAEVRAQ